MRQNMEAQNKLIKVSIHASVKDATTSNKMSIKLRCFNPRICKRCDIFTQLTIFTTTVSIHASVKDATEVMQRMAKMYTVSIHASVKDATTESCSSQSQISFNPRICKRCDAICFVGYYCLL